MSEPEAPAPAGAPVTDATPVSPFAVPGYRAFFLTRFASVAASTGLVVVLGYQLYDIARSAYGMSIAAAAFQLGVLGFAQFLPQVLLSPFAGLVADRFDRRRIAAITIGLTALLAALLLAATVLHLASLGLLFGLGAALGAVRVFQAPALGSVVPMLVPAAILPRTVAFNAMSYLVGSAGGPSIAGLLYGVAPWAPYALDVVLLLVALAAILTLPPLRPPATNRDTHPWTQIVAGWRFVGHDRFLLGCVTLDLFAVLLGGATALLPVFARDILTFNGHPVGAYGVGVMRALPGLGAALVAGLLTRHPIERGVGLKMLLAVAGYGVATIGFGLSRNLWLSLVMLGLIGATDMISVFIRTALVQVHVPDAMRGRVSALSGLAIAASNELGEFESGLAAAWLGATGAVLFGGIGAIVVTALWAVVFPALRRVDRFESVAADPEPASDRIAQPVGSPQPALTP